MKTVSRAYANRLPPAGLLRPVPGPGPAAALPHRADPPDRLRPEPHAYPRAAVRLCLRLAWGLAVGFIAPLLRHLLFGMPPILTAIAMAFELAAYGAFSGLLYRLLPKRPAYIYVSLIGAMVLGRVVWGCVQFVLAGLQSTTFPLSAFWAGAVTSAIPGIICHIVLIPILVMALQRGGVVLNGAAVDAPVGPRHAVSPHGTV